MSRQIATTDPDRGRIQLAYFANGLLQQSRDARGQIVRLDYDAAGRQVSREDLDRHGAVTRTARWMWDVNANGVPSGLSVGRVVSMSDVQAGTSLSALYQYDLDGHAVETKRCVDGKCMSTRSVYDIAGRLSGITYPNPKGRIGVGSETVPYLYNDAGRLVSVGGYATGLATISRRWSDAICGYRQWRDSGDHVQPEAQMGGQRHSIVSRGGPILRGD